MRQFVLYARKAPTGPDFPIEDLPGGGGRMDLVARCVCNALWISHGLRRDTCIHVVAYGPPRPPLVITFHGDRLRKVSPDERSIALWTKKVLSSKKNPGITVRKIGFQALIDELAEKGAFFYILHEKGTDIHEITLKPDAVFVLGDHIGLPEKEEKYVMRYDHERISLGKISYLASQCITIIHYLLDIQQQQSSTPNNTSNNASNSTSESTNSA